MNLLPPTKVFTQTKERDFDDVSVKDPLLLRGMKVVTVTKRHPSAGVDGNCFVNLTVFVTVVDSSQFLVDTKFYTNSVLKNSVIEVGTELNSNQK
jgi:hypothetical protein